MEQSIYKLMESISDHPAKDIVRPLIADVADRETMTAIQKVQAKVIFHAAAHKHVPLMKTIKEALRVTHWKLLRWLILRGIQCQRFVMISTDKAVNPTSIRATDASPGSFSIRNKYPDTRYIAVHFGNVLGNRSASSQI